MRWFSSHPFIKRKPAADDNEFLISFTEKRETEVKEIEVCISK